MKMEMREMMRYLCLMLLVDFQDDDDLDMEMELSTEDIGVPVTLPKRE